MKRIIAVALIAVIVAVPSLAYAQHGADSTNVPDIRREDSRQDRRQVPVVTPATTISISNPVKTEVSPSVNVADATISLQVAKDTAQAVFPDKTIAKVELEHEHGVLVYSVRFTDKSRVDVDAISGEVVHTRAASEDQSRRGHHDEDDNRSGSGHSDDHRGNSGRGHSEDD